MADQVQQWNLLQSPVPHWAELKSCMPIMDFKKPNHVKCMKCDKIMKKDRSPYSCICQNKRENFIHETKALFQKI